MGYWGWRPLTFCVFVSVWVIGCTYNYQAASTTSPTQYPPITLTVRVPISPTPTFSLFSPITTTFLPSPTPEHPFVSVSDPECYETVTNEILCLGEVHNRTTQSIGSVMVQIKLWRADETLLASQTVTIEQRLIPPGEFAPYRVQFRIAERLTNPLRVVAAVINAVPLDDPSYIELEVNEDHTTQIGNHYLVVFYVRNATTQTARDAQVVLSAYTADNRMVGYRSLKLSTPLSAGEGMPLVIAITPQENAIVARYKLYADALPGN